MNNGSSSEWQEVLSSGEWLSHRYDEQADSIRFRHVPKTRHRELTFLSEGEVGDGATAIIPRRVCLEAVTRAMVPAPRLILHSAFCCSTLLTRAFDQPGTSFGLSEPMILNDVVGLALRGGDPRQVAAAMDAALLLLSRPLASGEINVVKPSNVLNPLLPLILSLRPDARLLFLHAPLEDFIGSVARKEIEGRAWVRELMWKLIRLGAVARFGLSEEELYRQTDLQVAAMGWLVQHALFQEVARRSPEQVRVLDSGTLMDRPEDVLAALGAHFDIPIDAAAIARGPVFRRHSKDGSSFDAKARDEERARGLALHQREIGTVLEWSRRMAEFAGVQMRLPQPLLS